MSDNNSQQLSAPQPQPNALAAFAAPQMDLVGPTVVDDIRRAIWRYGAEAVKNAVKEATKAKRGRKREPDMVELRDVITADALEWLAGKDPFAARSNYAIAKDFAERNPGHSAISTHKRIERKLSKGPFDRRWQSRGLRAASCDLENGYSMRLIVAARALRCLRRTRARYS